MPFFDIFKSYRNHRNYLEYQIVKSNHGVGIVEKSFFFLIFFTFFIR